MSDYCKDIDIILAGFGYTRRTDIVEQPTQVVSGESFIVKIAPKNIFYKQFLQSTFDYIKDLMVLEFWPEDENGDLESTACVCSTEKRADIVDEKTEKNGHR